MNGFIDALMQYVIDPINWETLAAELEHLENNWNDGDTAEVLVQLSRAETLSWQIKQEGGEISGGSFAFALLDDQDRVVAHSDNLLQLGEYLGIGKKNKLKLNDDNSAKSFEAAKSRLRSTPRGHILVELAHPSAARNRFGYLVAQNDFPEALSLLGKGATRALLIAQEQTDDKLSSVLQASFALTAAETDIMLKVASGMTIKQTAAELGISVNTVRNHLQAIYTKSGINRQGDLVLVVTQLSIILAATGAGETSDHTDHGRRLNANTQQHFMILADGRKLAYRTFGNPMGQPVVYLHETIGSSRLLPGTHELAEQLGLYLIVPERPGFGHSDPNPDFSFEAVCADTVALLNHLRVSRCQLLGFISGGGYALMLANLHPQRVTRVMLVAARPPAPMTGTFQFLTAVREKMLGQPWFLSTFFNILRNRASEETNGKLIKSIYGSVPHDRAFLKSNPQVLEYMVGSTLESMSVSAAGIIHEMQCFNRARGNRLNDLQAPITVWHGNADNLAALEDLQKFLGDRISELRVFEEAGSLVLQEHWHAVLEYLSAGADDL
jgi:pimeloyl-ACP methyl ester carboxylesterase/DNA-binding CsgD family transcriptional regulator